MATSKGGKKLKVFKATLGFYDTVVAVPSQAAALRAWGTSQNLFKDGTARPSEDEKATKAALEKPGVVLRRPVGTKSTFGEGPGLPRISNLPPKNPSKPRARKAADRKALDKAEAALEGIKERHEEARAEFEERRREIDADEERAKARFDREETKARARITRERRAYEAAGGKL